MSDISIGIAKTLQEMVDEFIMPLYPKNSRYSNILIASEEIKFMRASRDAWKKVAETIAEKSYFMDDTGAKEICTHCYKEAYQFKDVAHSPDCPIEQLRKLQRSEG